MIDFFGQHGWLSGIDTQIRRRILEVGRPRSYVAGEMIYRIGEEPDGAYGLSKGNVSVSIPSDANTIFDCYIAQPGFWIGDSALFSNSKRLVSLTAINDVSCWFLPRSRITDMIRRDPSLYEAFYALNHINLATLMRLLGNIAIPDNRRRLGAWFLFVDESLPQTGDWIEVPQDLIAQQNNISLPTARRLLKRFEKEGLIQLGYGRARVADRKGLEAVSLI